MSKVSLIVIAFLSILNADVLKLYCKNYGGGSIQKMLIINLDTNHSRILFENLEFPPYLYQDYKDFIQVKFFTDANKTSRTIIELNKYFGDFKILEEHKNTNGKFVDKLQFQGVCVKTDPLF